MVRVISDNEAHKVVACKQPDNNCFVTFTKFDVTNRSQLILMAFQRVCPASNMIHLFRRSLDKHRLSKGEKPLIPDPLAQM